jgi:hypothetical protein
MVHIYVVPIARTRATLSEWRPFTAKNVHLLRDQYSTIKCDRLLLCLVMDCRSLLMMHCRSFLMIHCRSFLMMHCRSLLMMPSFFLRAAGHVWLKGPLCSSTVYTEVIKMWIQNYSLNQEFSNYAWSHSLSLVLTTLTWRRRFFTIVFMVIMWW